MISQGSRVEARWPIWGHVPAVETLSSAVSRNQVRHAYLIGGPSGVGKRALAQTFAQALCCLEPAVAGVPCLTCRSCRKIERGVHPDVQVFDLERQIAQATKTTGKNTTLTIDTVRFLASTAALRPVESAWRVLILDDAEAMQETAQEALLKTLEEPPAFVIIVMLATDAELLLPTVRSRCQQIDLALLPRSIVERGLIARGVAQDRAGELAGASGGAPGWAIRALDKPKLLSDRAETLARTLTWIQASPYERIVTAVRLGDSFSKRRPAVFEELSFALGVWRDALFLKCGQPAAISFPSAADGLTPAVETWSLPGILAARSVRQCIADLEANVRPRLAMESMVLQWPKT